MAGPMHERAWRPVLPCPPGAIPPDTTGVPPDRGRPARFTSPAGESGHVLSVPNVERASRPVPHCRSDARTGLETRSTLPARCHPAGPRASRPLHKPCRGIRPCLECPVLPCPLGAIPPDHGRPARCTSPAGESGHVSSVPFYLARPVPSRILRPHNHVRLPARLFLVSEYG